VAPVYTVTITAALLITAGLMLLLVRRVGISPLIAYLLAINTTTLLAYGHDKRIAGGDRQRVPERVLHGLTLVGGTPAALVGRLWFRHKTQKRTFRTWFWAIAVLQTAALAAWLWFHFR
jgi:uncharacterized membrane protein YsdA (DUF1294 family)